MNGRSAKKAVLESLPSWVRSRLPDKKIAFCFVIGALGTWGLFEFSVFDGKSGGWRKEQVSTIIAPSKKEDTIKITTGSQEGLYHQAGINLLSHLKTGEREACPVEARSVLMKVEVIESGGSVDNYEILKKREADFAIIQDDVVKDLESTDEVELVTPLFFEELTFVTLKKEWAYYHTQEDWRRLLKKIDVAIGGQTTGSHHTTVKFYRELFKDEAPADHLPKKRYSSMSDAIQDLQSFRIDGFFIVIGHPVLFLAREHVDELHLPLQFVTFPEYSVRASLYRYRGRSLDSDKGHDIARLAELIKSRFEHEDDIDSYRRMDPAYLRSDAFRRSQRSSELPQNATTAPNEK